MATHFVRRAATAQVSLLRHSSTFSSRNISTRLLSPSLAAQRRPQVVVPHARASTVSGNGNGGKNGNSSSSTVNNDDITEALSGPSPSQSTPAAQVPPSVPPSAPSSLESEPLDLGSVDDTTDWSRSYSGLSQQPFPKEVADVLLAPVDPVDVEIKPDGLLYLPEIKYRRVLNKAFGPGGWGLAPRGETHVGPKNVSREYALVCFGRLVAIARGEQEYFDQNGIPTATEAAKSNALMRCCKDLGIASELWDPRFIREFKAKYCLEIFAEHVMTKKKKKLWRRKDQPKLDYPFRE